MLLPFLVSLFTSSTAWAATVNTPLKRLVVDIDPFQDGRPPFERSLPLQILLTGIVLTLVAVLLIHLLFTAQYHWPLAPVNYVLQVSGVITLLITLIATLHVVLTATLEQASNWPYMLHYYQFNVPPRKVDTDEAYATAWRPVEKATWMLLTATTGALIQITHIQFLTLLYPSKLEGRLIYSLLGPLAVIAAVMQLVLIQDDEKVNLVANAIKNVCNATLSLLFTLALFFWGLLVNRTQAWRTDGGTGVFGAAALVLAVVSTALNFLYVPREEEFVWLPGLMWAVVLWQSFLGWWWWVGASGGGRIEVKEEEDIAQHLRKGRRKKHHRKRHGIDQETRTRIAYRGANGTLNHRPESSHSRPNSRLRRRQGTIRSGGDGHTEADADGSTTYPVASTSRNATSSGNDDGQESDTSVTSSTSSGTLPAILPGFMHNWYDSLRAAHHTAARRQAEERVARIRELDRNEPVNNGINGWGLGAFAFRRRITSRSRSRSPSPIELEARNVPDQDITERTFSDEERDVIRDPENTSSSRQQGSDSLPTTTTTQCGVNENRPRSIWWWGPLGRWRLRDSTSY